MAIPEETKVTKQFEALNGLRILVLGDVMIDSYLWGNVDRMSPEAPVPVVSVKKREKRLGGAANVALNLRALGVEPIVVSVIGDDPDGDEMQSLFKKRKLSTKGLISVPNRVTTIKHRIISDKHLLRVDSEQTDEIDLSAQKELIHRFGQLVCSCQCVIFQDYDKGVLSKSVIEQCVAIANKYDVPTTVDPKKRNFDFYEGVTLFKPNLKEINEGLGDELKGTEFDKIAARALEFIKSKNINKALITLSENGVMLITKEGSVYRAKAHPRHIKDVSGAGDTVISVASAFLAMSATDQEVLEYSNLSGGLVCEKIGVVPVNKKELFLQARQLNFS